MDVFRKHDEEMMELFHRTKKNAVLVRKLAVMVGTLTCIRHLHQNPHLCPESQWCA